jgi:hypothetical protein
MSSSCRRDDCYHSYKHHHPGTETTVSHFGARGKLGRCRIVTCRCRGYIPGGRKKRPAGVPMLCPSCANDRHAHAKFGRKCLSHVAAAPRNWVCTCEINRDSDDEPYVSGFTQEYKLTRREIAEIIEAQEVES